MTLRPPRCITNKTWKMVHAELHKLYFKRLFFIRKRIYVNFRNWLDIVSFRLINYDSTKSQIEFLDPLRVRFELTEKETKRERKEILFPIGDRSTSFPSAHPHSPLSSPLLSPLFFFAMPYKSTGTQEWQAGMCTVGCT